MLILQLKRGMWLANDKFVWHIDYITGQTWHLTHDEFDEVIKMLRE